MDKKENFNPTRLNGMDGSRSNSMPSISSITSLTSSDSSVSSCSDFSVDASSYCRGYQDEGSIDNGQEDPICDSSLPPHAIGFHKSNVVVKRNQEESNNGKCQPEYNGVERAILPIEEEDEIGTYDSHNEEMDANFWLPPEPEDEENDLEGSVANYEDDDDEFDNGMKWGKPSSLSSFGDEGSGSYRFKEDKEKAMNEVMNGKFKALVGQLLKSVDVSCGGKGDDDWVDVVTSLSWEAASFVKPDTVEGKAMDPDGYVKIKCIATGSRTQSQVFKGLVFKKHAAHKRMPTKYTNPRLLLIQGALDLSSSGLSSFEAMKQEKDSLNSIIDLIERCHPNVVLVEKTVSRDIQESILSKGMTLVFDMKLHRLERVARCTGSLILSTDLPIGQKLKQCDSFHIEKFVEEHAAFGEGGKRPSKTLMFLEGCPTRRGCTILLKGSHSDELKRIKCVIRYAVLMAYHLMLETSFLLDQRAMFSTILLNGVVSSTLTDQPTSNGSGDPNVHRVEESIAENDLSSTIDIPISNGFHDKGTHNMGIEIPISNGFHDEGTHNMGFEEESLYKPYNPVIFSGFSSLSASLKKAIGDGFPLFSNFNGTDTEGHNDTSVDISSSPEAIDNFDEEKALNNEKPQFSSLDTQKSYDNEEQVNKDEIRTVMDSDSILVLLSRRNASRGTICEQSHFSHIKFYRNFDVPLGKFLRDNLLNQRLLCSTCGEPPEAHFYYYAHHNKQLTIKVKRLNMEKRLPGETEGKLWMWSCCGKCKHHNGNSKSTRRVLISAAARGFSFGKFLELGLSSHSSFRRPSSCGHFLHKDFNYFFGLGPMVAMFRYSAVATYTVSLPPQRLDFRYSIGGEFLSEDFGNLHVKGDLMFLELERSLKKIRSRFAGSTLNLEGSLKEFSDIEEMLKNERNLFEWRSFLLESHTGQEDVNIENIMKNGSPDEAVYKLVCLNRVQWELLLESCIWDQRLHSLLSSDFTYAEIGTNVEAQTYLNKDNLVGEDTSGAAEISTKSGNKVCENTTDPETGLETSPQESDSTYIEIPIEGENESCDDQNCTEDNHNVLSSVKSGKIVPITRDYSVSGGKSLFPTLSNVENSKGWIWIPFPEIRSEYLKELHRGYAPKFEITNMQGRGSRVHDMIIDEGSRLHIPLGDEDYIVSDYEDELSSVIACALALLKDTPIPAEDNGDNSHGLARISSMASPHWSSFGSLDSEGIESLASISSEDSHFSNIIGSYLLDSLVSLRSPHPKVHMGLRKYPGKGKYYVACLYASEFEDLRSRCCSSELAYIASLSRCKSWDAKGGKSKSFFAKTRDDRFIIKEIKRIEYDSFMTFASDYFKYMKQCHDLGNQTCLAKILGIYQVRVTKNGKEARHDLMVMENLTFGRNVSRQYDLKGALHARFNSAAADGQDVLLDQNFVNDMNVSPLYLSRTAKRNLQRAVWNDTTFLNSINVMDYSLLVGVDGHRRELVCGIIDYLRQYTWDKQLENWVKSSLVVPKNQRPTVISPKEYKQRFRKFITAHFLSVPDNWCSRSSTPQVGTITDDDDEKISREK
ncbi:hypothetical protein LguiA_004773 [Lonicera macranthoides]